MSVLSTLACCCPLHCVGGRSPVQDQPSPRTCTGSNCSVLATSAQHAATAVSVPIAGEQQRTPGARPGHTPAFSSIGAANLVSLAAQMQQLLSGAKCAAALGVSCTKHHSCQVWLVPAAPVHVNLGQADCVQQGRLVLSPIGIVQLTAYAPWGT